MGLVGRLKLRAEGEEMRLIISRQGRKTSPMGGSSVLLVELMGGFQERGGLLASVHNPSGPETVVVDARRSRPAISSKVGI